MITLCPVLLVNARGIYPVRINSVFKPTDGMQKAVQISANFEFLSTGARALYVLDKDCLRTFVRAPSVG